MSHENVPLDFNYLLAAAEKHKINHALLVTAISTLRQAKKGHINRPIEDLNKCLEIVAKAGLSLEQIYIEPAEEKERD